MPRVWPKKGKKKKKGRDHKLSYKERCWYLQGLHENNFWQKDKKKKKKIIFTTPAACGSSQARDGIHATEVIIPGP